MAKVSTEINKLYSFSNQHCFSILKDSVIPNFQAEYKVGYFKLKMPYGKIVCKDISDRDDFRVCKALIQFKYIHPTGIKYSFGSPIKILCRATGDNSSSIDIVTDGTNFYSTQFWNFVIDIRNKIPLYNFLYRTIYPNIYFDDLKVIGSKEFKEKSFRKDVGKIGFRYLLRKMHKQLSVKLEAKNQEE